MENNVESYVLDRFEFSLKDYGITLYKEVIGTEWVSPYYDKKLKTKEDVDGVIQEMLKERKRYNQLLNTLTVAELNSLFKHSNVMLLTPKQIKEMFSEVEVVRYKIVRDDDYFCDVVYEGDCLRQAQSTLAEYLGLMFYNKLDLVSECGEICTGGR